MRQTSEAPEERRQSDSFAVPETERERTGSSFSNSSGFRSEKEKTLPDASGLPNGEKETLPEASASRGAEVDSLSGASSFCGAEEASLSETPAKDHADPGPTVQGTVPGSEAEFSDRTGKKAAPKSRKERVLAFFKKWLMFFLNPHLLICFGIAWMITNGWCYLFILFGSVFRIGWMLAVGGGYGAILWLPFTPEKIITVMIAIFLLRLIFPRDEKTLLVLRQEFEEIKASLASKKKKRKKSSDET